MNSFFRKRVNLLVLVFVSWGGLIIFRLYQTMISDREAYLQDFHANSWRIGTIPALRGRILDKNGNPLAWSIRYFSLSYDIPEDDEQFVQDITALNTVLTGYRHLTVRSLYGRSVILKKGLSPGEILRLRPLVHSNNRFQIKSSFRREYANRAKELLSVIGRTQIVQNVEVGVSGLERKYNFRLTGQNGKYRVMVDKDNNWISATWGEIQAPVPGFDVYVSTEF